MYFCISSSLDTRSRRSSFSSIIECKYCVVMWVFMAEVLLSSRLLNLMLILILNFKQSPFSFDVADFNRFWNYKSLQRVNLIENGQEENGWKLRVAGPGGRSGGHVRNLQGETRVRKEELHSEKSKDKKRQAQPPVRGVPERGHAAQKHQAPQHRAVD